MKKFLVVLCSALLGSFILATVAQAADANKLAFVNLARCFSEYSKTKDFDKALTDKENVYTAERDKKLADLNSLKDKFSLLSDKEKEVLFTKIKKVLRKAIYYGGSSVDNYVRLSGKPGGYAVYHKVYGKAGKPCPVCKTTIKRISLGGRGTYFCPNCQKGSAG